MDDLSRVVNFFAFGWDGVDNDGKASLGFRGPRAFCFEFSLARAGGAGEMDGGLSISAAF